MTAQFVGGHHGQRAVPDTKKYDAILIQDPAFWFAVA